VNNERIVLSPQDVFQHFMRTKEQEQAERSLSEAFWWMRTYGCVKEVDCLYTETWDVPILSLQGRETVSNIKFFVFSNYSISTILINDYFIY
jgi:hypothetical protein